MTSKSEKHHGSRLSRISFNGSPKQAFQLNRKDHPCSSTGPGLRPKRKISLHIFYPLLYIRYSISGLFLLAHGESPSVVLYLQKDGTAGKTQVNRTGASP